MKINRNNYETYFFDYWDSNLSPGKEKEVFDFLEANPDLQDEFLESKSLFLVADQKIIYPGKTGLKKNEITPHLHINEDNYESLFISYWEGKLKKDEREATDTFIYKNPFLKKELDAFRHTFIHPEANMVYPGKEDLKRPAKAKRILLYRLLPAAAAIALLAGIYFMLSTGTQRGLKRIVTSNNSSIESIAFTPEENHSSIPVKVRMTSITAFNEYYENETTYNEGRRPEDVFAKLQPIVLNSIPAKEKALFNLSFRTMDEQPVVAMQQDTGKEGNRTAVGIIIRGFANSLKSLIPIKGPDPKKSILELTVDGYNLIADKNISVEKETDENGRVISMNLETRFFSYNRGQSVHQQE